MRGNVVIAAIIFAAGLVVAAMVVVFGVHWVVDGAAGRLEAAAAGHAKSVERAGELAGAPINRGLDSLSGAIGTHGKSVETAGERISRPTIPADYTIRLQGPVAVQQPMIIRGPAEDGALPVNAKIGK
jgi:hypothetical protein